MENRTNAWLAARLQYLHQTYFDDIAIPNLILVKFGRASRTRFGSIVARTRPGEREITTYITINSLFKDETVPEYVIDATLMHEFTHYAHGFHSPLPQKYRYPHQGGIVDKEIIVRGGEHLLRQQKEWIKKDYKPFLRSKHLL